MNKTIGSELTGDEAPSRETVRGLEEFIRTLLLTGIPADSIARTLSGQPDPQMEESLQNLRDRTLREARVELGLEVATTLKRLDILWAAMMSKGDHAGALRVLQERARFTRSADYVTYAPARDARRPKSQDELDREQIDPVELEELNVEYRKRMAALAGETRARRTLENAAAVRTKTPEA